MQPDLAMLDMVEHAHRIQNTQLRDDANRKCVYQPHSVRNFLVEVNVKVENVENKGKKGKRTGLILFYNQYRCTLLNIKTYN